MDRWLAALERRFGRYVPGNLTYYMVGLMGVAFVLSLVAPGVLDLLALDPEKVMQGQVWRLFSYLILPPTTSPIFFVFAIWWLHYMGVTLERDWGSVKFLVWWIVGMIGTTAFAFFLHIPATNGFLLMALFLAFATLYPDEEMLLFFFIPMKVKWLAIVDAIGLVALTATLPGMQKVLPLVAIGNYLLFFTPTLARLLRGYVREGRRPASRRRFRDAAPEARKPRACAVCGVTDEDPSVDIRVCSCEKCGKPTELCLPHARNH